MHKPVEAGQLITKVEFQEDIGTQDAAGQYRPRWVKRFTRNARVWNFAAGKETFRNDQVRQTSTREITVRGDAQTRTITELMRVVIVRTGQVFNIVDVDSFEQKGLEIVITAVRGEGGWINLAGDLACSASFSGEAA